MARYLACIVYRLFIKGQARVDRGAEHFERNRRTRDLARLQAQAGLRGFASFPSRRTGIKIRLLLFTDWVSADVFPHSAATETVRRAWRLQQPCFPVPALPAEQVVAAASGPCGHGGCGRKSCRHALPQGVAARVSC